MVALVVAYSKNRAIGRDGALPWRLPTDMKFFRELTTGHPVVMGRKTYESIPQRFRPLPERRNLVLSRDPSYGAEGAETFADLDAALRACEGTCFVIGGADVYAQALPLAARVHATEVQGDVEGDAFFPDLPASEWTASERGEPVSENGHTFRFVTYDRTR